MGVSIGVLVLVGALAVGVSHLIRRFFQTAIYDMRLVDEKTARVACRVRLRLVVITTLTPEQHKALPAQRSFQKRWQTLRTWLRQPVAQCWQTACSAYQEWRQQRQQWREIVEPQQDLLAILAAAYRQYHTAAGGYFVSRHLSARLVRQLWREQRQQPGWASGVARSTHLLSVADLATLWHLPQAQDLADLPYVARGRARTLLAPSILSTGQGYRLGISTHAGQTAPVYLPSECLRHNLLAVASTGKGKSTLFQHLAGAAMQDHARGLVVMEPHGDLIARLAGSIPDMRQDQVVLIDLANTAFPIGINPLDMALGRDRDKAVDNVIQIAEALWAQSYGPRTENVLEYAAKTLAEANASLVLADPTHGPTCQYTLLDVVPLLRRTSFRHAVLEQVQDPMLLEWWKTYYEPLDLRMQSEVTSSVITKLSKFASSRVARRILGQAQTSVNFREIIRQGKILLVSTASGVVGADISAFLGATLLGLLQTTLAEQAALPPDARRPMVMLIDEFQVYNGVNYQTMLAELRKYGGSFGLATQSLSYLDRFERSLRQTVLANIDHLFAFTMAVEDAHMLGLEEVEEADVTMLDDYQCYACLSVGGRRLPLFSLQLDAPPESSAEQARVLVQQSQQRDAHPVGSVDAALDESLHRQRTAEPNNPAFFSEPADTTAGRTGNAPSHQGGAPGGKGQAGSRTRKRGRGGKAQATAPTSPSDTATTSAPIPAPTPHISCHVF